MRRVLTTFVLTGLGYAATLLYTYLVIQMADSPTIARLNKYESFLAILMSLISLGVIQDASRNIAKNQSKWRETYSAAQSFRLILALLVSSVCIAIYLVTKSDLYLLGLATISMALSGEFALYALGRPIAASSASFIRAISFSSVIIFSVLSGLGLSAYAVLLASIFSFVICGGFAAKLMDVDYVFKPKATLGLLKTVGLIAVFVFTYNSIKPAYIFLIDDAITYDESVYYFEAFKLYFLLFSIRRILVQVFYREIINNKQSLRYDLIVAVVVCLAVASLWALKVMISFTSIQFVGMSYAVLFDVSIMAGLFCVFSTSFTRLFALKKDSLIAVPVMLTLLFIVVGVRVLSTFQAGVSGYLYLLGAAEMILSLVSFGLLKFYCTTESRAGIGNFTAKNTMDDKIR